ncbi:MAG TPA: PEP-CTERM sorting domain-containing protein [Caldimonas sp.]|nr:PEP-CTERM sorting domain-containing protein [Caldimonas sp.]
MQDIADRTNAVAARRSVRHAPLVLLAGLLCAGFAAPAAAEPPPPAVTSAFIEVGGEGQLDAENRATSVGNVSNYTGFGNDSLLYVGSGLIAAGGSGSISRNMTPAPLPVLEISATASVGGRVSEDVLPMRSSGTLGGYGALGNTRLQYSFAWAGPGGSVNLAFLGKIKAEGTGTDGGGVGTSSAHIAIVGLFEDDIGTFTDGEHLDRSWIDASGVQHVSHDSNYGFTSYQDNGVVAIQANTWYTIDMAVSAGATTLASYVLPGATASADAFADPYLSLDPSTPNAAAYTLEISPGIGNGPLEVTSVPEPETWALFVGGLSVVGFVSRRRIVRWGRLETKRDFHPCPR